MDKKYHLCIELERVDRKNVKKLIECHGISEVAAYNLIKLYSNVVCSLEITLREEAEKWPELTGEK